MNGRKPSKASRDKTLIPIEQRTVIFYDDELTAVLVDDDRGRTVYVPIRPICEGMGISWNGQRERIQRDPILNDLTVSARVTRAESKRGGRDMLCLPLRYLPGWLFGVNANRVKSELRNDDDVPF